MSCGNDWCLFSYQPRVRVNDDTRCENSSFSSMRKTRAWRRSRSLFTTDGSHLYHPYRACRAGPPFCPCPEIRSQFGRYRRVPDDLYHWTPGHSLEEESRHPLMTAIVNRHAVSAAAVVARRTRECSGRTVFGLEEA